MSDLLSAVASAGPSPRGPLVLSVPVGSLAALSLRTASGSVGTTWQGHAPAVDAPGDPGQKTEQPQEQNEPNAGSPPVVPLTVKPGLAAAETDWQQQYQQYRQQDLGSHLADHLSYATSSEALTPALRRQHERQAGSSAGPDPAGHSTTHSSCSSLHEVGIAVPPAQPYTGKLGASGAPTCSTQQQLNAASLATCAAAQAGAASRKTSSAILISKLETAVSVPLPGSPHRLSVSSSRGLGALRALKARLAAGRRRTSSSEAQD